MVEGIKFVLVGDRTSELEEIVDGLTLLEISGEQMSTLAAADATFDGRHIALVDIDLGNGLRLAHRIAFKSPGCVVATMSDHDRPADNLMHIVKPIGYIDIQLLLIRAGAVIY